MSSPDPFYDQTPLDPIDVAELPLQPGDRVEVFQNADTIQDAEIVSLPDGVRLRRVAVAER